MFARLTTVLSFIFILVVCLAILSSFCFQQATAVSKSQRSSRQKKSEGCSVSKDSHGLYYLKCPTKTPPGKTGNRRKKCNGCRGKKGSRGQKGKQGPKGRAGARGSRGLPGTPGRPGYDGAPGQPGTKGLIGPPGRKGEAGAAGPMGPRGYQGRQGDRGSPGIPGTPGLPGNCISNPKQLASTIPPVHCVRGPSGSAGPKGEPGLLGNVGPKGEKGMKGDTGEPGSRGRKGTQGPPGVFKDIRCSTRQTKWVQTKKWNTSSLEVFCNRREFLQGFRTERDVSGKRKRYRYTCCTIKPRGGDS